MLPKRERAWSNYLPKQNQTTLGSLKYTLPGKKQEKETLVRTRKVWRCIKAAKTEANSPLPWTEHCANSSMQVTSVNSHENGTPYRWLRHGACGILVLDQGSNLCHLQRKQSPNHWSTMEVPMMRLLLSHGRLKTNQPTRRLHYVSKVIKSVCKKHKI